MPWACQNTVYAGKPWRLFQTRKREHMEKVRVTNEDLHKGNTIARIRISKEDGGLAWHTMECQSGVDGGTQRS